MAEQRIITKTGAELQDTIQLLDQLTSEKFFGVGAFDIVTGSAAITAIGSSTVVGYALDAASAEAVGMNIRIPNDLPGIDVTQAVDIFINWSANATTNDVVWDLDFVVAALGEDIGAAVTNSTVTDTTAGTADFASEAPKLTIAADVLTAADGLWITIRREAADGSDDMAGDASFNGVRVVYTTNPNIV